MTWHGCWCCMTAARFIMAWVLMMHDGYCTVVYIFFKDHWVSQVEVVHVKCPRRPVENAHYWWDVLSHWAHHTIRGSSFFLLLSITEYSGGIIYSNIYIYIYPSFRLSLLTFLLLRFILLFFFAFGLFVGWIYRWRIHTLSPSLALLLGGVTRLISLAPWR